MYDKYPIHDVPQQNIIQRFFSQRWSAIVIEIVMTIVITFAAGHAFDFFEPFDDKQDTSAKTAQSVAIAPATGDLPTRDPLSVFKERGVEYIRSRRFAAAEAMYDLVIALEPDDANNYVWRGYVNLQTGDYLGAQDDYRRVLEIEPADFDGHNSLCWAYGESKQFASAMAHCELALQSAGSLPEYVIALENRCWLRVEMGEYEAAAQDCLTVLETFPGCGEVCALAHYNLGRVLVAQGNLRESLPHFNLASRIGSTYARMYLEIAAVYDTLGYRSAALASYANYHELVGDGVAGSAND